MANDTYVKAMEQLGHSELQTRVGAIYALEKIAIEEKRYHWSVMETFCVYIRERAAVPQADGMKSQSETNFGASPETGQMPELPPTDIQAILTVIGRRTKKHRKMEKKHSQKLDLSRADLRYADLKKGVFDDASFMGSNLNKAILDEAHLKRTMLRWAHMKNGSLFRTHLQNADLDQTNLKGAHLEEAHMECASLDGACLKGAFLEETHLECASLNEANLKGACLTGAHLQKAMFRGANLEGADLRGACLKGANFSRAFLKKAKFDGCPKKLGATWDDGLAPHDLKEIIIDPASEARD